MSDESGISAQGQPEPQVYTAADGSFSVRIERLESTLFMMTKTGYQTLEDVGAEGELITRYLNEHGNGSTPYLCVDVTNFKGLSRKTRKIQAQLINDMPFAAVAAFGLSLPLRVFASVLVRRTEAKPIRVFADRTDALTYLKTLQSQRRNSSVDGPHQGTRSRQPSDPLPTHLVAKYAQSQVTERFGFLEYPVISPKDWEYHSDEAPFTVKNSLLGSDIILSRSSGRLTADVVNDTESHTHRLTDEIGTEDLYFIHDARDVSRVERTARLALRARYARNSSTTKLTVIVGHPIHAIMVRWMRVLAPSIFKDWTMTSTLESALKLVETHRAEKNALAKKKGPQDTFVDGHPDGFASTHDEQWIPETREELVALVQNQKQLLDEQEETLNQIVDRLGRMSWEEGLGPDEASYPMGPPYDLVFGALDLMDSDIRDIIDTLNAHMEELTESEHHLENAQRIARLGSWEWDFSTGALKWSDETFRIYGHEPQSLEPTYDFFLAHLHPDSRSETEAAVEAAIREDTAFSVQQTIIRKDGRQAIGVSRGYVEKNENGEPQRMYGTTHDITELVEARTAERLLHEEMATREASLRETLMDLSHDVRTPLASLKLGLSRFADTKANSQLKSSLIAEVEYLDGLFSNLIALVRYKSSTIELKMNPICLTDVLERVKARLGILAMDRGISLDISIPETSPQTFADPLAIEQAVGNLVHNAIKFAKAHVAVLLDYQDAHAIFEIRDDGPGMSTMEIPRVTDRYYRGLDRENKAGRGLGLGLPIAMAITDEHGGQLSVARLEDEGTVVRVQIPIMYTNAQGAE